MTAAISTTELSHIFLKIETHSFWKFKNEYIYTVFYKQLQFKSGCKNNV